MHPKLPRTSIVALTLAAVLTAACQKNSDSSGTSGTPGTGSGVRVTQVSIGRSLNASKTINDSTDSFTPNDTVYASVATEGSAASAALKARWTYQDGQVVNESTQTIAPTGPAVTEFHVSKPDGWPPGKYKLEILLNGSFAAARDFNVQR
jgi:hypothetical protein